MQNLASLPAFLHFVRMMRYDSDGIELPVLLGACRASLYPLPACLHCLWACCIGCGPIKRSHSGTLRGVAARGTGGGSRGDRIDLGIAAEPLIMARQVQLPSGELATVDNRWLSEALAAADPNTRAIAERLGALIDAQAVGASVDPAVATSTLDDILSRPPFDQPDSEPPGWLADLINWLLEQLGRVAGPAIQGGAAGGNAISWGFAVVGIVLILVVIFFWVRGLRRLKVAELAAQEDPEATLTSAEAVQQASGLARDGDYRRAVRYLYLASLIWLDERGAMRYERTLTNREHLARLADQPHLREQLRPVVDTFDRVWYGSEQLDAESFAAYEQQVRALRQENR